MTSGAHVPRGGPEEQIYPYEKVRKLNTKDKVEEDAKLATNNGVPFCGVVGLSPLRGLSTDSVGFCVRINAWSGYWSYEAIEWSMV